MSITLLVLLGGQESREFEPDVIDFIETVIIAIAEILGDFIVVDT